MKVQKTSSEISPINRSQHIVQVLIAVLFILSITVTAYTPSARADATTPTDPTATQAVLNSSVFGLQIFPFGDPGIESYINGSFTRWVRGPEVLWKDVEATKGAYNWNAIDKAVSDIQKAAAVNTGTSVIVVVRSTPAWARTDDTAAFSCGPIKASERQAFSTFMLNLITKFQERGVLGYVKYWELWNEPDIRPISTSDPDQPWGGCWGDPNDAYYGGGAYGEMLKVVYPTIKTVDPQAQVMVGGLNLDCDPRVSPPPNGKADCNSSKFLEGILLAGAGNSFDGVALHAFDYVQKSGSTYLLGQYYNPNWPGSGWNQNGPAVIAKSRFVKEVLEKYRPIYGYGSKFLMNTEASLLDANYSTLNNPYPAILETTKSYYLAETYAASMAEGLKGVIWFDVIGSWLRNNGIIKLDASASLDAYSAYNAAASQSGNPGYPSYVNTFKYQNNLSFPGITGYEFAYTPSSNPYGLQPYHVWMLWSNDGAIHNLVLPYMSPAVLNVKGETIFSNVSSVSISLQPYYIIMSPTVVRSRFPIVVRSKFNGDFEYAWTNWTQLNGGMPTSLVSSNPADPRDPTGATPDTFVPADTTSALLGDSSLGMGQSKGSCAALDLPAGKYAGIERTILVPTAPSGQTVRLSFDYIMYSQDDKNYDAFNVYLTDVTAGQVTPTLIHTDGNTAFNPSDVCKWYRVPSDENSRDGVTTGWANKTMVLTDYQGHTIKLTFKNQNGPDSFYNTYTYLDNVKIIVGP